MKVGDRFVVISKEYTHKDLYEKVGELIAIDDGDYLIKFDNWFGGHSGFVNGKRMSEESNCYFMPPNEIILEDIFHSPLFRAMREEEEVK